MINDKIDSLVNFSFRLPQLVFVRMILCFSVKEESTTLRADVRRVLILLWSFVFGLGLAVYMCGHFPVRPQSLIEKTDKWRDSPSSLIRTRLQNSPFGSCRILIIISRSVFWVDWPIPPELLIVAVPQRGRQLQIIRLPIG